MAASKKRGARTGAKAKATPKKKAAPKAKRAKRTDADIAAERKSLIASGALIEGPGDTEFVRVDRNGDIGKIQQRAEAVLDELKKSKKPVVVRDVITKHGGQFPQYLAMFQLLEAQGEVVPYRQRGGGRGKGASQVAYLHRSHA